MYVGLFDTDVCSSQGDLVSFFTEVLKQHLTTKNLLKSRMGLIIACV